MTAQNVDISNEEEGERLRYLQSVYAQDYEGILDTLSNYTAISEAVSKNIEVLGKMDEIKDKKILMHLESGTYIETKITDSSKVLTYVGAGYLVEKSIADAKAFLEENAKRGNAFIEHLNSEKEKLEGVLLDIAYRLESIGGDDGHV
ncbi:MAG: prefoldin subunit alpha [Candidatus Micrarchaeia archaeon]